MLRKKEKVIPIRPHHGMCLAYFEGKGYSSDFTRHMKEMLDIFEKNVQVQLVVSGDEICSACPNDRNGECCDKKLVEAYDRAVLEYCEWEEGTILYFKEFAEKVQKNVIDAGYRDKICGNCQWNDICSRKVSRWKK